MKLPAMYLTLALAALAPPLAAQSDTDRVLELREAQQREWIEQTRARYQAEFRKQEIACYQRFAVNDCLQDSRRTERELMADLRRQEILINDAQRKRRAARQLLRTDEKLHGQGEP
ncbi:MAG: hypothetical protein KDH18_06620 [Rhodoferax sp.]|nr:hypothetical protein [Rhodoferax sp.]MCW5645371.1 hypothetical protein [Rhodoferax sp.]